MGLMEEKEVAERVGKIIRFHRKRVRLTQERLAKFAEVGKTAVFDIEKGKSTVRLSTLLRILHVLNIKMEFSSPLMHFFERSKK